MMENDIQPQTEQHGATHHVSAQHNNAPQSQSESHAQSWGWLFRGRWLLGHFIILALVVLFSLLSQWQFHRLDQRRAEIAHIRQQQEKPVVALSSASQAGLENWQRVKVSGVREQEVLLRHRLRNGLPGAEILSQVRLDDSSRVWLDEGWIQQDLVAKLRAPVFADRQVVDAIGIWHSANGANVHGYAPAKRATSTTSDASATSTASATSSTLFTNLHVRSPTPNVSGEPNAVTTSVKAFGPLVARVDRAGRQEGGRQESAVAGSTVEQRAISAKATPDLSERSHFSYALQWIAFAALAVIGWGVVLWREFWQRRSRDLVAAL